MSIKIHLARWGRIFTVCWILLGVIVYYWRFTDYLLTSHHKEFQHVVKTLQSWWP